MAGAIKSLAVLISIGFFAAFLGCGEAIFGDDESTIPDEVAKFRILIKPGETTRDELNHVFDSPIIVSESWQIELYHFEHTDLMAVGPSFPIPIPLIPLSKGEKIFLLVVYDNNWRVQAYDIGYVIEKDIGRNKSPEFKSANAEDFQLSYDNWGSENPDDVLLYAPNFYTSSVLKSRPENSCNVFITTTRGHARVFLNGNLILNETLFPIQGILSIDLSPGRHILKVKPESLFWSKGTLSKYLECKLGQRLFVEIDTYYSKPSFFSRDELTGNIRLSNVPSQVFEESSLILYHNGKWVGPDKPD